MSTACLSSSPQLPENLSTFVASYPLKDQLSDDHILFFGNPSTYHVYHIISKNNHVAIMLCSCRSHLCLLHPIYNCLANVGQLVSNDPQPDSTDWSPSLMSPLEIGFPSAATPSFQQDSHSPFQLGFSTPAASIAPRRSKWLTGVQLVEPEKLQKSCWKNQAVMWLSWSTPYFEKLDNLDRLFGLRGSAELMAISWVQEMSLAYLTLKCQRSIVPNIREKTKQNLWKPV
ncbi:hypothetical protein V8E55_007192 [Tylopilus felleus]